MGASVGLFGLGSRPLGHRRIGLLTAMSWSVASSVGLFGLGLRPLRHGRWLLVLGFSDWAPDREAMVDGFKCWAFRIGPPTAKSRSVASSVGLFGLARRPLSHGRWLLVLGFSDWAPDREAMVDSF